MINDEGDNLPTSKILQELSELKKLTEGVSNLLEGQVHLHKFIFTHEEAANYVGLSESYLHKLCSQRKITFYSPRHGRKYYKREDLNSWLLKNRKEKNLLQHLKV